MPKSPAAGEDEAVPARPAITCQVRYHFRERLEGVKPGGKAFSAPAFEQEALKPSRSMVSDGKQTQLVEGRVAHLPYRFAIKLIGSGGTDADKLEVNILDANGKPLRGYPQTIKNPFAKAASAKEFEVPLAPALVKAIQKTLLAKNQYLTWVELIVASE
jgi:hypothetical protein